MGASRTVAECPLMSSPAPTHAPAPRPVLTVKQAQRARAPWIAMVLSTLMVLGIAAAVLMMNQSPATPPRADRVDVAAAAATVPQEEGDLPALAPQVPEGWTSNYARLTRLDGLPTWEVGWVVTETVFAGLRQSAEADRTWTTLRVGTAPAVGSVETDGVRWEHFTPQGTDEQHLVTRTEGGTVVLTTTGDRAVLEDLARAVAKEIR